MNFYLIETKLFRPSTKRSFYERNVTSAENEQVAIEKDNEMFLSIMRNVNKMDIDITSKVLEVNTIGESLYKQCFSSEVIQN